MAKMTRKKCYYCGKQIGDTGSKEHVPPEMMFKAYPGIDKITVYSCYQHNNGKEEQDRHVVIFLLKSAKKLAPNQDILSAAQQAHKTISQTENGNPDYVLTDKLPESLSEILHEQPYIKEEYDIEGWMRMLTAALVYDGLDDHFESTINWDDAIVWCPTFARTNNPSISLDDSIEIAADMNFYREMDEIVVRKFEWYQGWQSGRNPYPPEIYYFDVNFDDKGICFRHRFYNQSYWYVYFEAPRKSIDKIRRNVFK